MRRVLPENLLLCGLLSPQGHRSWQEHAPAWAPCRVTSSFRHPPALGSCTGCGWISASPGTPMGCLTMTFTTGCSRISALAPEAPLAPSLTCSLSFFRVAVVRLYFSRLSTLSQGLLTDTALVCVLDPAGTGPFWYEGMLLASWYIRYSCILSHYLNHAHKANIQSSFQPAETNGDYNIERTGEASGKRHE